MNSPFTREESMFARDVHRLANNIEKFCGRVDKLIELLEHQKQ